MFKQNNVLNLIVVGVGFATAFLVASVLQSLDTESELKEWPRFADGKRVFPDIQLTTHEGETVAFYTDLIENRQAFVYFIYTRCTGTCVPSTKNLVQVQKLLKENTDEEVLFIAITLDPEHDDPTVLKEYRERHGIRDDWVFLTGDVREINQLRRNIGFFDFDLEVDSDKSEHAALVAYGNDKTGAWGAAPALLPPEQIASAALLLMTDFSERQSEVAMRGPVSRNN